MTASVVGDAPVSMGSQKDHLVIPCVGAEAPPVAEDHGLSLAPVFIVELGAVFGGDCFHTTVRFGLGVQSCAMPPSRTSSCPVMKEASMEARNATALPISSA